MSRWQTGAFSHDPDSVQQGESSLHLVYGKPKSSAARTPSERLQVMIEPCTNCAKCHQAVLLICGQMQVYSTPSLEDSMCCGRSLCTCQGGCNRIISALGGWQGAQLHGRAGCWAVGGAAPAQVIWAGDHPHRHGPIPPEVLRQGVCQLFCPAKPLERPCRVEPTLHCLLGALLPVLNCLCSTRC